jgi:hypothetical protein
MSQELKFFHAFSAVQAPPEHLEEWEALAYIIHMLSSGPGAATAAAAAAAAGAQPGTLDVRASGIPQVCGALSMPIGTVL